VDTYRAEKTLIIHNNSDTSSRVSGGAWVLWLEGAAFEDVGDGEDDADGGQGGQG